jgi:hypothetical protein
MRKSKPAAADQPLVREHVVVLRPETPASEQGFKTCWQGGNPFERMEFAPKVEKAGRR